MAYPPEPGAPSSLLATLLALALRGGDTTGGVEQRALPGAEQRARPPLRPMGAMPGQPMAGPYNHPLPQPWSPDPFSVLRMMNQFGDPGGWRGPLRSY